MQSAKLWPSSRSAQFNKHLMIDCNDDPNKIHNRQQPDLDDSPLKALSEQEHFVVHHIQECDS